MTTKRWTISALVVGLLLTAAAPVAAAAPHKSRVPREKPKVAVVYGDSLLDETKSDLVKDMRLQRAWKIDVRAYPATAVCDWLAKSQTDRATLHPAFVAVESVGASMTSCMIDPATGGYFVYGSQAWADKYAEDLDTFFASVTATGARAVFIAAPPDEWMGNLDTEAIVGIAEHEASKYPGAGVDLDPALAVTANGDFAWTLPCLWTETASEGCSLGQIVIRRMDGMHFCPGPWADHFVKNCPVYSSGEHRFALAIAASIEAS